MNLKNNKLFGWVESLFLSTLSATLLTLSFSQSAKAISIGEPPDAGALPTTAFDATRVAPAGTSIDEITGRISNSGVDLYKLFVPGGQFSARVTNLGTSNNLDLQLFLFDSLGNAVIGNDDRGGNPNFFPSITIPLSRGNYFLGVSLFDNDPVDAAGNFLFTNNFFGNQRPRGAGPVARWSRGEGPDDKRGRYRIALRGVETIPTPALLPGLIGMGFGVLRKRRLEDAEIEA